MSNPLPYLIYMYQSRGLEPKTSARYDSYSEYFWAPEPASTDAFQWIVEELRRDGSDMNRLYDGIVILVNKHNRAKDAPAIVASATQVGFEHLRHGIPLGLRESMELAGFYDDRRQDWCDALLLRKDGKPLLEMLGSWVSPLVAQGYTCDATDYDGGLSVFRSGAKLGWIRCRGGMHYFKPTDVAGLLREQQRLAGFLIEYSPGTASDELRAFSRGEVET